jgi:hypothetical protein
MNKPVVTLPANADPVTYVWPQTGLYLGDMIEVLRDGELIGTCQVDEHYSRSTLALRIKRAIVPLGTIPTNFALNPIIIPGHTETAQLPKGTWGINIAAAVDNFPNDGLQIFIDPWSGMAVGDTVSIMLDDVMVAPKTIRESEKGKQVTLFVKPERLIDGDHLIKYRIKSFNGNEQDSVEQKLHIKLTRPGGQDQNGDIPGHSELLFTLPQEIIEGGVDEEVAEKGVMVTIGKTAGVPYPYAAAGDEIRVSWGGLFEYYVLTADQAAGRAPIEVLVAPETIREAGDSDSLSVTYEVYDRVRNRSMDWAIEVRILVDANGLRIDSPIIRETDYDPETERQSIDLGKHTSITAEIPIPSSGPNFKVGDKIVMRLKGTTAEGTSLDITYPGNTLERLGYVMAIELSINDLRQLATSQAIFSFEVIKADGSANLKSKGLFVAVLGELQKLAAPHVEEAAGIIIDPTLTQATVVIPWDDTMQAGMVIVPQWLGTRPDLSTYLPDLGYHVISQGDWNKKEPIAFKVNAQHIKEIDGGKLELYYLLHTDTTLQASAPRESLHTPQFLVGDPRGELDAPSVTEAPDNRTLPPDLEEAELVVPNYSGKAKGDYIHILWEGSDGNKYEDSIPVSEFTKDKPISFTIDKAYIKPNEGGTVKASYWVERANNGGTSTSDFLTLNVGEPVGGELDEPIIELIEDGVLDPDAVTGSTLPVRIPRWPGLVAGDGLVVEWIKGGDAENPIETITRSVTSGEAGGTGDLTRNFKKDTVEASVEAEVTVQYRVEPFGK